FQRYFCVLRNRIGDDNGVRKWIGIIGEFIQNRFIDRCIHWYGFSKRIVIAIMKPGNPYISAAAAAAGKITINRKAAAEYYQISAADLCSGKCIIPITSAEQ